MADKGPSFGWKRGVSSLLSYGKTFADLRLADQNTKEIGGFAD
jgi:hypothetical protein